MQRTDALAHEAEEPNRATEPSFAAVDAARLRAWVGIRDRRTILEAAKNDAGTVKDHALTELVRERLGRQITSRFVDDAASSRPSCSRPTSKAALRGRERAGVDASALVPHVVTVKGGREPLLLVAPERRRCVAALTARHAPGLAVMSLRELDPRA